MAEQRQTKTLFAQLTECTSARGSKYLKGWAGVSGLLAFPGDPDEQGRPTWRLYLAERNPKPGTVPDSRRERQERASAPVTRAGVDPDFDDDLRF
jgi:hypothetical protein